MKVLKSWIAQYLPEIKSKTDSEVAELLHLAGIEVEGVETGLHDNVVVAKIITVEKHPDADRLNLASVTDNVSEYKVVCGAPNIKPGQIVPLAKIGAILPGGFEIKRAKIRGIESEGMLCAEDELGLGTSHDGIIELSDQYELGKPLSEYIKKETVFDISITPNRGDWLSNLGIARELGAFIGTQVKKQPISLKQSTAKASELISVEIKDNKKCPQYYARVIKNVKIGSSPDWLKNHLEASGVRSINNVVDVTNYILLDSGHPLHAFDFKKVSNQIIVRCAEEGEKITVLDGSTKELSKEDLVIADAKKAIAIAGVMGGENSEVSEETTDIILEAAVFDQVSIRKTAKRLKLQTDASYRFERGIDNGDTEYVINKAAKMIAEIAGGTILSGIIKAGQSFKEQKVKIDYNKINSLLGLELSSDQINRNLKLLGFELDNLTATVPLWRHDISIIEDLAEEVGRLNGYDKIKSIKPEKLEPPKFSTYYYEQYAKEILLKSGFSETISYPYLSQKDIESLKLNSKNLIEVVNPLQEEFKYLRISLIPGLIKAIAKNPAFDSVMLFEVSHVYFKDDEKTNLAIVASGKNAKKQLEDTILNLEQALQKKIKANVLEISGEELASFKVKKPVVFAIEISLDELLQRAKVPAEKLIPKASKKEIIYRPISKFPMITRDLAFVVNKSIKPKEVIKEIYTISELINRVELFDEFASDKFGIGKKNIAFHIYLQNMERTMVDKEADDIVNKIIKAINNKFGGELRK